jgi:serine O-acetyltransferase
MTNKELKRYIISDLNRIYYKASFKHFLVALLFNASFKITFWLRLGRYFEAKKFKYNKLFYYLIFLIHKHNQYKTGIQIAFKTDIGLGLFFNHFSCIVIDSSVIIGDNCTIMHGVTLGSVRGKGSPKLGNNIVVSAGAKVLGDVKIGDNVMIGANSVVVKDVPENAVVAGNPAKILNFNGVKHTNLYKYN